MVRLLLRVKKKEVPKCAVGQGKERSWFGLEIYKLESRKGLGTKLDSVRQNSELWGVLWRYLCTCPCIK